MNEIECGAYLARAISGRRRGHQNGRTTPTRGRGLRAAGYAGSGRDDAGSVGLAGASRFGEGHAFGSGRGHSHNHITCFEAGVDHRHMLGKIGGSYGGGAGVDGAGGGTSTAAGGGFDAEGWSLVLVPARTVSP
jgi:hypothetical protein